MTDKRIAIEMRNGSSFRAHRALPQSGSGPALLLVPDIDESEVLLREKAELYAEEGYVVLAPDLRAEPGQGFAELRALVEAARAMSEVTGPAGEKKVGALGFGVGGTLACLAAERSTVDCAVAYCPVDLEEALAGEGQGGAPVVLHFGGRDERVPQAAVERVRGKWSGRHETEIHLYPAGGHDFAQQGSSDWHKPSATAAYSRSLTLLRRVLGPRYDLSALWDAHCYHEFVARDADATMKTMVAQPYVNHVPIMVGGYGQAELRRFYANHFVNHNPKDLNIIPLSRTIGSDRLVDEMLACFTHDIEMDWMLPGIPPTGKYVEVPLVVVVQFRGDKIWGEQLYWDQASVLVQLGLLDPESLPVSGLESARKRRDDSLPSNTLMRRWTDSVSKPGM